MLKPDTRFVVPYLAAVGSLAGEMEAVDIGHAWDSLRNRINEEFGAEAEGVFLPKLTFLTRPLRMLMANPHVTMGWLMFNFGKSFSVDGDRVVWKRNPLRVMEDLYFYLRLEARPMAPPSQKIWDHDHSMLVRGQEFYSDLEELLEIDSEEGYSKSVRNTNPNDSTLYEDLDRSLRMEKNPFPSGKGGLKSDRIDDELFQRCQSAHRGWQLGLSLLDIIIHLGLRAGIFDFKVDHSLRPVVPPRFLDPAKQKDYFNSLAPPPRASSNEIVALTGGMFYSRETPQSPPYVEVGQHFDVGQPLYIIEVMKMFNKIHAEFAGTVDEVLVTGDAGVVVKKGQTLFKVTPDVELKIETEEEREKRRKSSTEGILEKISF